MLLAPPCTVTPPPDDDVTDAPAPSPVEAATVATVAVAAFEKQHQVKGMRSALIGIWKFAFFYPIIFHIEKMHAC